MLADLNQRLRQAAQRMAQWEKSGRRLQDLAAEEAEAAAAVERFGRTLRREERDVTRLERFSLSGVFHSLLGDREARLRREQQEAMAARLKYEAATQHLAALRSERERLQREREALGDPQGEYQRLLAEKEKSISQARDEGARRLFALTEAEHRCEQALQEWQEAVAAAEGADAALAAVERSLDSAHDWGVWDMLGGGLIATAIKHDRIDAAQEQAHAAQRALAALRRELRDVHIDFDPRSIGVDGFSRFADYFFDGLIADWVVQGQINDSLDCVRRTRERVATLLARLRSQAEIAEAELQAARKERQNFVAQFEG